MSSEPPAGPATDSTDRILERCLAEPDAEVAAAIERACREHPERSAEIRERFEALCEAGLIPAPAAADGEPLLRVPERLGEFRLLRRLGSGGMGVVYLARDESLGREIALKLVRPELLFFPGARRRFEREVAAIARLEHPGIVPIYRHGDAGGIPYFAMQRIDGCTAGELLRELAGVPARERTPERLAEALVACSDIGDARAIDPAAFGRTWIEACLRIARQAAEALAHCHARGVFHRDVKPSNLALLADGRVQLLDFGLARAEGAPRLTRTQSTLGSLHYLPPERVRGLPEIDDARADVYALGVTLYEMLAGAPPYDAESGETLRARILAAEPTPLNIANRDVPWDVQTVCAKAMEPDPARRYESAEAFAGDITNVLELRPIKARRPGRALLVRRWAQRHPTLATALFLGFLLLIVAPSVAFVWIRRERDQAVAARETAEHERYAASVLAAELCRRNDEIPEAKRLLDACPEGLRGWEWRFLRATTDMSHRTISTDKPADQVALRPDNRVVAAICDDPGLRRYDLTTGAELPRLRLGGTKLSCVAWSPDGRWLAAGNRHGEVSLCTAAGEPVREFAADRSVTRAIAFRPDSRALAVLCVDPDMARGSLTLWEVATAKELRRHRLARPEASRGVTTSGAPTIAFDAAGRQVAFGFVRSVFVWEPDGRTQPARLGRHAGYVTGIAFDPDGEHLWSAGHGHRVHRWHLATGKVVETHRPHHRQVSDLFLLDGGKRFLTVSWDKSIRIWTRSGERVAGLHGHEHFVLDAVLDTTGKTLVTAGYDSTIRVWSLDFDRYARALRGHSRSVTSAVFARDGGRLYTGSYDKSIGIWDAASGARLGSIEGHGAAVSGLAVTADRMLVSCSYDGTVRLWDPAAATQLRASKPLGTKLNDLTLSADGSRVACAAEDGRVFVLDATNAVPLRVLDGPGAAVLCVGFDPNGRWLAAGDRDGKLKLWTIDGEEVTAIVAHESRVSALAWSPDGARLATGSRDRTIRLWDAAGHDCLRTLHGHDSGVTDLAFGPNGDRLFSVGSGDRTLRVWHPGRGLRLLVLRPHESPILCLAVGPRGRIVTGSMDHTATLLSHQAAEVTIK